ncbi:MAG: thioredoxin family protein [Ignavibacteria bacterium]|nr:thioredoxin family protein [Ignavibacteria bacterium]
MVIKILGVGCNRCRKLEQQVKDLVTEKNIDTTIEKVTNIDDMMKYGIMTTPGLVINDKLKSTGILPKNEQILKWIEEEKK